MTNLRLPSHRRVYVVCEGQTEEAIAKQTLGPHLESRRIILVPWVVKTKRPAGGAAHRGGGRWTQGPTTHPSARIKAAWPRFAKTSDGPSLVAAVGLPTIRAACPHFDRWLCAIERL